MQTNNSLFRNVRNLRAILSGAVAGLLGIAGIVFGVYLIFNPMTDENGDVTHAPDYFFMIGGAVLLIIGIIFIVGAIKRMKTSKPLTEEEIRANEAKFNEGRPEIENLQDVKLFFHFGGKMNQSFFVEDKNGNKKYECKLVKFNPFGANTFDFVDVENNYIKTFKIGKTITTTSDGGMPIVGDILDNHFNINGTNCWEYLHQRGFEIKHFLFESDLMRYELTKSGNLIAKIFPANIKDPFNEESRNILRMGRGVYRLEILDAALEDVVMAAFIISQLEMIQ